MEAKEIYLKIKREITKGLYAYDDQIAAIAKWVESEFEPKKQGKKLPIHNVSGSFLSDDEIRDAADEWVFEINGMKWSNNDDTAGDNFGSFIAGAKWVLSRLSNDR